MQAIRPPFPMALDSTMLRDFRNCPKKFQYSHLEHWKLKGEKIDLTAGHAFASGIEAVRRAFFDTGISRDDSLIAGAKALILDYGAAECPAENPKSLSNMLGALSEYFTVHGLETDHLRPLRLPDGTHAVEFTFALPVPGEIPHPETGDPILYSGRCDMLADYNDMVFICDEKTTKQLGPTWPNQWTLRSQITSYVWAARAYGHDCAGAIIRGIAIRKYDYGHAEVILYRPQWQIDRWLAQTERDIKRMIRSWEEGYFDYNLDDSCSQYGGCQFLGVCSSNTPETWLEAGFEKRVWNPLRHIEVKEIDLA